MSRFGWAFVNDVIIGTGSAGTGSSVDGPAHAVVVKDGGIVSGATNFNFNNSTGFGQLTGSLAITNNLIVTGNLTSGPISTTTITATTNVSASSLTGTLRSNTGNKFGSSAGDVHQFTGSIRIAGNFISGSESRFGTITGSAITGSTLLYNNATINNANITTINTTTNTTSVLYVTGATNSVISGKLIGSLGSAVHSNRLDIGPASVENLTTFYIKPDGSRLYAYDSTSPGNELVVLSFATPWDITTLSTARQYSSGENAVPRAASDTVATGITFKPDGTKAYILTSTPSQELYETSLSVPWDLSTTSWSKKVTLTGSGGSISGQQGISISEDGRYLFTCSGSHTTSRAIRYTMSTAWDASTINHTSFTTASLGLGSSVSVSDLAISNDGKSILILDSNTVLHDYELAIPYDLTTITEKSTISLTTISPTYAISDCMFLKPDQTKIYFNSSNAGKYITSLSMTSSQVDLVGGIHITGDAKITQNIDVYGDATFEDLSGSNARFRTLSGSLVNLTTVTGSLLSSSAGQFAQLTASTATINLISGSTLISGSIIPSQTNLYSLGSLSNKWKDVFVSGAINTDSIAANLLRSTGSNAYIVVGTGSNNTLVEVAHTGGNVFRGMRILSGTTEKWFAGADTNDNYVVRAPWSTVNVTPIAFVSSSQNIITNWPFSASNGLSASAITLPNSSITNNMLATISGSGKVTNAATTATSTNTNNTIVARDASGNFVAGRIEVTTLTGSTGLSGSQGQFTHLTASSGRFTTLSASSTLEIGGNTTLGTAATTTTINGQTQFNEIVNVAAGKTFTAATVDINGGNIDNTAIGSSIQSTGKFSSLSASSNLEIGGNTTIAGNLTVSGTIELGNATTDTINVNGDLVVDDLSTFKNTMTARSILPETDNTYGLGGSSSTRWSNLYVSYINAYNDVIVTGGDLKCLTGAIIRGTPIAAAATGMHIKQASNNDGAGLRIESTGSSTSKYWDIFYTSFDNLQFANNGTNLGYVRFTGGTNTQLQNFTGQHRCNTNNTDDVLYFKEKIGLIVVSSGEYLNYSGSFIKPTINESLPKIILSSKRNQKNAFGVVSDAEDLNSTSREYTFGNFVTQHFKEATAEDTRVIVNSLGEGGIWVCNINGNLENGDYITTCEVPGYGMKQDDDLLHNYTVAKITQDCTFELNNPNYDCVEFQFSGSTYRKAFVGCTYHCG